MSIEYDPSAALRAALRQIVDIPEHDIENVKVFIEAGEWGVALETLCTQAYEYDCVLEDSSPRDVDRPRNATWSSSQPTAG